MFNFEIGSEFTNGWGGFRKIVAQHKDAAGNVWYWAEDEDGEPQTCAEDYVDGWTRIVPFFKKGDTFEANGRHGEVMFVTDDNQAALVRYDGRCYETVTAMTYRNATSIKHN